MVDCRTRIKMSGTGMRMGAEVRNHLFIFYLLNFICILSQKYNFDFNI